MTSPDFMNVLFAVRQQTRQYPNSKFHPEQVIMKPKTKVKRSSTLFSNLLSFAKRIKSRHTIQS